MEGQASTPDAFVSIHVVKLTVIEVLACDMTLGEPILFPPTQAHFSSRLSMRNALKLLAARMPTAIKATGAALPVGTPAFVATPLPVPANGQTCRH